MGPVTFIYVQIHSIICGNCNPLKLVDEVYLSLTKTEGDDDDDKYDDDEEIMIMNCLYKMVDIKKMLKKVISSWDHC